MDFLWYCLISAIVYAVVVLLGDFECLEGTVFDRLSHYLTFGVFYLFEAFLRACCGRKASESVLSGLQSFFNSPRNPIGQLVFIGIYGGCVMGVVNQIFPKVHALHKAVGSLWFIAILLLYAIVCQSDPGKVVDSNQVEMIRLFPPDGVLHVEKLCDTCMKLRPARGKHHDKHCIALYDHYCVWVKNSIGLFNMRYFLLFLILTSLACAHGAIVGSYLVHSDMMSRSWNIGSYRYEIILRILANEYGPISALISFLSICSLVLFLFFLSQVWQILKGITTYESMKIRLMNQAGRSQYRKDLSKKHLWLVLWPHYYLEQMRQKNE